MHSRPTVIEFMERTVYVAVAPDSTLLFASESVSDATNYKSDHWELRVRRATPQEKRLMFETVDFDEAGKMIATGE